MKRKTLPVAVATALAVPVPAHAIKYQLSGQVSRAVVYMDDGQRSDVRHVDSATSGTRWRLRGSEALGNGMKVGFYYEMQTSSAPGGSAFPNQNTDGANGVSDNGDIRQANVWFSGGWGKLSIGQLDGAGNATTEVDLSGMDLSGVYAARTDFTGGIGWRTSQGGVLRKPAPGTFSFDEDTGTVLEDDGAVITAGQTSSNFDAFSRYDGVRYDSPALGPVTLSASMGNDDKWEVAARVSTTLGGGQLSGAAFYGENDQASTGDGGVDGRYGGSVSYLFSQGTNLSFAYAVSEPEARGAVDQSNWFLKLGHKWGAHAVGVSYGVTDDLGLVGNEDSGFGVGYSYQMPKVNTELYAAYLHQELDVDAARNPGLAGVSVEDIEVFLVGARVQFN